MKIRHYILRLAPKYGGPTASVPVQCIGTQRLGADMSIVVYDDNKPYLEELKKNGVEIVEVQSPMSLMSSFFSLTLKRYLDNDIDAPDIYHYHGVWLPCNHWVSIASWRRNKKTVLNPRGDLELSRVHYNKWKRLKKWLVWHLYGKRDTNHAACIIATSSQEAEGLRAQGVTAPIAIIPNGIELAGFPKGVQHEHHEKKVMLFLSRVNPIKGLEYLIEAWHALPLEIRDNWELHIAGNSDPVDYIEKLRKKVNEAGLQECIKFVGQIVGEEKMRKYMDSDLFVLPTLNENFGNVIAEALMCECPAITTKNAPWRCLEDYDCGWWINLSVEKLRETLKEAMSLSDEQRWEMGRRGRHCIEDCFESGSVAKKTMAVYRWVLGEEEKPDFIQTL